jgi:predicted permease
MRSVVFDLRDAFRSLRRERAYTATVILTLTLTLGATTAVFSIVNGVLLKPLAYRESHRLVALGEIWRQVADRFPELPVNEQHFEYWRAHATTFESLAQYIALSANLTGSGEATPITVVHASASLFNVLQVPASIGRTFAADDERPGRPAVVVVTNRLWRERLGADPAVLGRAIVLDGTPHTVVGVLPPGFRLPMHQQLTANLDAFVPIRLEDDRVGWVGDHNDSAIGRLREGVTPDQARAELNTLQAQVSELATNEAHQPVTLTAAMTPLADTIVGRARRALLLLLAAIAAVLLIACSNLANLSLTRTLAHVRDAAIRAALGASRARLLSRLVIEQLVLALAGGAAGVLVALWAIAAFVRTAPIDLPRAADVTLDGRVLLFAGAIAIAAGLIVAIVPASHLAATDVHERLRANGLATTDTRRGLRTRSVLLVLQIAVSVVLLAVTGLLTLSFVRLLRSDPGFEPRQTLAVDVVLPLKRYGDQAQRAQLSDRVLERVRAVPGVTTAAWTQILPLAGQGGVNFIAREGDRRPWSLQPTANYRYVSADFFKALSIPLRRGRTFVETDRARATIAALVTESTVSRVWPNINPIGQRFRWNPDPSEKEAEVVGVVPDTKTNIDRTPPLMVYMPYWYRPQPSVSLVVHTGVDPVSVTSGVRHAIQEIDPEIAVASARPMDEIVDSALGGRRYQMWLFVTFGAMALMIATVGVYGVTAYGVSRRRREMNIRVALGGRRSQVFGMVVRQGFWPVAGGLARGGRGRRCGEYRRREPVVRCSASRSARARRRGRGGRDDCARGLPRRRAPGACHRAGVGAASGIERRVHHRLRFTRPPRLDMKRHDICSRSRSASRWMCDSRTRTTA